MPALLKKLMRHSSIETTMPYYVDLDAGEIAEQLWASHTPEKDVYNIFLTTLARKRSRNRKRPHRSSDGSR